MTTEINISGSEETVKSTITLLMGINQLIQDKDIGQFLGQSTEEWSRANPNTIRLIVVLHNVQIPPWKAPEGKLLRRVRVVVPDVDRRKVTWQNIKNACGGANGYSYGNFLAIAKLDNGRQMQAYGGSRSEAEKRINAFLALSKANLLTLSINELTDKGRRAKGQSMYIDTERVYPSWFSLVNSEKINSVEARAEAEERGIKRRSKLRGDYLEKGSKKILLYPQTEPQDAKIIINNALSKIVKS